MGIRYDIEQYRTWKTRKRYFECFIVFYENMTNNFTF